jgi:predicted transposase YbfD/YdcC
VNGRIETRNCKVYNQIHLLEDLEKWIDLKSVIQITSEIEINEKKRNETRLYISSLNNEAEAFNKYIRGHWGVENSLHWTLDMTFREDEQSKRDKNSAQNFSIDVIMTIILNYICLSIVILGVFRTNQEKNGEKSFFYRSGKISIMLNKLV